MTTIRGALQSIAGNIGKVLSPANRVEEPPPMLPQSPGPPLSSKWIAGLDLGMMSDFTALAILRQDTIASEGKRLRRYACLHLQRWLGVDYPTIAGELDDMFASLSPPATLVIDETGVGIAVTQILRRAKLPIAKLRGITITAGHQVNDRPDGGYNVPKKQLVSAGQAKLQTGQLDIHPKLKDAAALRKELATFTAKIRLNATESFEAWRESDKDDLVFACCMAIWYGEHAGRHLGPEHFGV